MRIFWKIFFVLWIVFTFASPLIVKRLSQRSLVKSGKVKDKKNCKCKTQGRIYKTEDSGRLNDNGRGIYTRAYYEFYVNGVRYLGCGRIYGNPFNTQTVTVLYDPMDPNNNCTEYGKRDDNGTNYLIALGITFGIIAVLFVIFIFFLMLLKLSR